MRQARFPVFHSLLLLTACFLRTHGKLQNGKKAPPLHLVKVGELQPNQETRPKAQPSQRANRPGHTRPLAMQNVNVLRQEQAAPEREAAEEKRAKGKQAELQAKAQEELQAEAEAKEQTGEAKKKQAHQQAKGEAEAHSCSWHLCLWRLGILLHWLWPRQAPHETRS
jgi:hypothetical protein